MGHIFAAGNNYLFGISFISAYTFNDCSNYFLWFFLYMVRIRKSDNRNQSIIIDGTLHKWLFFTSFFTNITSRFITPANRDNYQFGFRDCLMICFEKRDFVFIKFWIFSLDPAIRRCIIYLKINQKLTISQQWTTTRRYKSNVRTDFISKNTRKKNNQSKSNKSTNKRVIIK